MNFGYARVSTDDQATSAQLDALRAAGCERMFEETASGGRWDRPELHRMLDQLRQGDVVIVWKLDRLSRSLKDLLSIMEKIDKYKPARGEALSKSPRVPHDTDLDHLIDRSRQEREIETCTKCIAEQ